jgi:putative flippase GtrA
LESNFSSSQGSHSAPAGLVRFLCAGGIAAFLNWGSRLVFSLFVDYELAVTMAFFVGLASGFVIMNRWVFPGGAAPMQRRMVWYVTVNAVALVQTVLISSFLADWLAVPYPRQAESVAHGVGIVVPALSSFIGHKLVTFRRTP